MTPEARVRTALEELGAALIDLARERPATPVEPVELISPAEFARRASLGRSSTYLGITDGSIRSVRVRGRRLIPATELVRLVEEAGPHRKAARAIVSPRAAVTEGMSRARRRRTA